MKIISVHISWKDVFFGKYFFQGLGAFFVTIKPLIWASLLEIFPLPNTEKVFGIDLFGQYILRSIFRTLANFPTLNPLYAILIYIVSGLSLSSTNYNHVAQLLQGLYGNESPKWRAQRTHIPYMSTCLMCPRAQVYFTDWKI